jgi:hypothetical protein
MVRSSTGYQLSCASAPSHRRARRHTANHVVRPRAKNPCSCEQKSTESTNRPRRSFPSLSLFDRCCPYSAFGRNSKCAKSAASATSSLTERRPRPQRSRPSSRGADAWTIWSAERHLTAYEPGTTPIMVSACLTKENTTKLSAPFLGRHHDHF